MMRDQKITRKRWSQEDDATLKEMSEMGFGNQEIAQELGRTPAAIAGRKWDMSRKPTSNNSRWSEEEDQILREMMQEGNTGAQIAKRLGRTRNAVSGRKWKLGLDGRITRSQKNTPVPYTANPGSRKSQSSKPGSAPIESSVKPQAPATSMTRELSLDQILSMAKSKGMKVTVTFG